MLTQQQIDEYQDNGFLILKSFYDVDTEIKPIQYAIYKIIRLIIKREGLNIEQEPFSVENFDSGFMELLRHDRALGGIVYDASKQIPEFVRLVANPKNQSLFEQLFNTDAAGIAQGAQGVRIDIPLEEKYKSPWHQEYLAHMRSLNGLVYWSPILTMSHELGPVEICVGSHKEGIFPLRTKDPKNPDKYGAYAMIMDNEEDVVSKYEHILPLTDLSDLVILDWMTLHRSTCNVSTKPRWTMQMRYFDFNEPTGIKFGWPGGVVVGKDIKEFHPELIVGE